MEQLLFSPENLELLFQNFINNIKNNYTNAAKHKEQIAVFFKTMVFLSFKKIKPELKKLKKEYILLTFNNFCENVLLQEFQEFYKELEKRNHPKMAVQHKETDRINETYANLVQSREKKVVVENHLFIPQKQADLKPIQSQAEERQNPEELLKSELTKRKEDLKISEDLPSNEILEILSKK